MKRLKLVGISTIIFFSYCYSMESYKPTAKIMEYGPITPDQKSESKYCFHQQINDMCMIAPMLNLKLLESAQNIDGTYDFEKLSFYSRREWMALNMPYLLIWHGIIESLNHAEGKQKYPDLIHFVEAAKKYGPMFPHFYDKKGASFLSSGIGDVFSGTLQAPYFLIDFDAVKRFKFTVFGWPAFSMGDLGPGLGLLLPIFKEKNKPFFQIPRVTGEYPHQRVDFEQFQLSYINNAPDLSMFNDAHYQGVNKLTALSVEKGNFLGFDQVLKTVGTARGYLSSAIEYQPRFESHEIQQQLKGLVKQSARQSEFLTFALGLYKLMLLSLGIIDHPTTYVDLIIDEQENEMIAEEESSIQQIIVKATRNIHEYVEQNPKNPWHSTYFSKEDFLQHAIAEILKEDKDLYNEVKAVNDFYFPVWGTYDRYLKLMANGECFNAANERYYANLAKYFLPSEEYVMAYGLTQNAWYLSIGAINSAAFYKALTNDTGHIRGMVVGTLWPLFKNRAYGVKNIPGTNTSLSYMDVWKKVVKKIGDKYGYKNWVSFSGHGLVISFDKELIAKQRKMGNADAALFNELGFTIIDSWLATELNTFYKTTEKKNE